MVGSDFLFLDKHLLDFNMIMAKPNVDAVSGLNREILKGSTNAYRSQAIHYGTKYSDVLTLSIFIIKYNCDYDDIEISPFELRKLQSWLTSNKLPQSLYVYSKEGITYEYYGIFTEITPFSINGLNGLNLTFTCDSPYVYDTKKAIINKEEAVNTKLQRLYCDTDETEEPIYPYIEFIPNSAGEISFVNHNDEDKEMKLTFSEKYEKVIIDCKLKRIIADGKALSLSDVGWSVENLSDFNNVNTGLYKMYWLRLLPERNYVDVTGDGDFTITYKNLQKLGGLVYV